MGLDEEKSECTGLDKQKISAHNCKYFLTRIFSSPNSIPVTPASVRTCPRYIMRFAICTAVFSEVRVRLGLVQYGAMGLKWACGVNLVRLQWPWTCK